MAIKVEPHILKIWKNYNRINNPILHTIPIDKKSIALSIEYDKGIFILRF